MEVGKVYRVKENALNYDARYWQENKSTVEAHGWLWVCEGVGAGERALYKCRSIATGERSQWFSSEVDLLEE